MQYVAVIALLGGYMTAVHCFFQVILNHALPSISFASGGDGVSAHVILM